MITDKKTANAVGGKTARACDSCMRKRARWYCAADDAFLCQGCDASVHSANSLARRHERVRLKNVPFKPTQEDSLRNSLPAWHQGFCRKARTPRTKPSKFQEHVMNPLPPLVPEIGSDVTTPDENDEQLLYRVPIFDPFEAELCASTMPNEAQRSANDVPTLTNVESDSKILLHEYGNEEFGNLHGLLPSDMDLADFAADVETLLGRGLDEDSFGMEGLGLMETRDDDNSNIEMCYESGRVKMEEEEDVKAVAACHVDPELDMSRGDTLDLNFDCESPTTGEEEEEEKVMGAASSMNMNSGYNKVEEMNRRISLRLDYKAVIDAWASQGLPWMSGKRPQLNLEECWSDGLGLCSTDVHHMYGDMGGIGGGHMGAMGGDGGREARVSRYREKRRTRLFSKKIRYEVRKLNAEKRPRMKGRFVKRSSFVGVGGPTFPF